MTQLPHIGILKTDGGPHPLEKWAEATANEIANLVVVDESSTSDAAKAARRAKPRFALDLRDAFEELYGKIRDRTASDLKGDSSKILGLPDYKKLASSLVSATLGAASKTQFADHFKRPEVVAHLTKVIEEDVHGIIHERRSWYADVNSANPHVKEWVGAHR